MALYLTIYDRKLENYITCILKLPHIPDLPVHRDILSFTNQLLYYLSFIHLHGITFKPNFVLIFEVYCSLNRMHFTHICLFARWLQIYTCLGIRIKGSVCRKWILLGSAQQVLYFMRELIAGSTAMLIFVFWQSFIRTFHFSPAYWETTRVGHICHRFNLQNNTACHKT